MSKQMFGSKTSESSSFKLNASPFVPNAKF